MDVKISIETARGCGYRKPGGMYLIGGKLSAPCGLLPFELSVCNCCGQGIKPARGFTWISASIFNTEKQCTGKCFSCPIPSLSVNKQKMGLIWVGEKFYTTPEQFVNEAAKKGISRRISQLPKDLVIGETWVCFAHRKAVLSVGEYGIDYLPGIFQMFIPQKIQYVIEGNETEKQLETMVKRGFELIKVIRDIDTQQALKVK